MACKDSSPTDLASRAPSSSSGQNTPSKWKSTSVFPLTLKVSNDFSNAEKSAIQDTAEEWSKAVGNSVQFFDAAQVTTVTKSDSPSSSFNDGVFGIYKMSTWPSEMPSGALAVAQIHGLQHTSHIQITHADILINSQDHDFSTDNTIGYDLQTVVLHEMGHFLGLYHDNSSRDSSVMYPSISPSTNNRAPKSADTINIKSKYGLNTGTSNLSFSSGAEAEDEGEGTPVTLTFYMMADGTERLTIKTKSTEKIQHLNCKH